jgi:hypothetical protein
MLWSTVGLDEEVNAAMPASKPHSIAYGLLATMLGLGYAAAVLILAQFVSVGSSPVVVAIATLATAALLHPAWRRSQRALQRHFHRRLPAG